MKGSFKKIAAFLIVLAVIIPLCIVGASSDDPAPIVPNPNWGPVANDKKIFEISSAADLLAMAANRGSYKSYEGYTISLTADIDLNPGWDASSKVAPTNLWPGMFYFYGTFDGAGHTIKGLCQMGAENGCFITCGLFKDGSTGIKNLQIENSYFQGTKNAGIISATRGTVLLENLYVDAIVESGDCAGGLVSWFFTSDATSTPKAVLTNCVFAGSVSAKGSAGGLVGTNNKTNAVGIGTYDIILTDCANYGTVVSETEGKVAGLIGSCVNNAKLTRCYNAGAATVYTPEVPAVPATDTEPEIPAVPASTAPAPALLNVTAGTVATEAAPTVEILDCYYLAGEGVVGMAKAADATGTVTVKYAGVEATELATATVAELVAKNEFQANDAYKGWAANAENTLALPLVVYENINGHDFEDVVTAPTCSQEGYTTHTCKTCGHSYVDSYTERTPHTESDWIVDNEPTEERAGLRHKECTVCGQVLKQEPIPKLSSSDTGDPATTEPNNTTEETPKKKKGCGSSIAVGSALGILATLSLGIAAFGKKKK